MAAPRKHLLPHFTLAQVFDALCYYSEHQAEIDVYMARNRIPEELIDPLVTDQGAASSLSCISMKMWTC